MHLLQAQSAPALRGATATGSTWGGSSRRGKKWRGTVSGAEAEAQGQAAVNKLDICSGPLPLGQWLLLPSWVAGCSCADAPLLCLRRVQFTT